MEEAVFDLRSAVIMGRRPLRILPRLASMIGALGALYQLFWLMGADHGLDGLMAGLPERLATERALSSVGWGAGSWLFGSLAARGPRRRDRSLYAEAREVVDRARDRCEGEVAVAVDPPSGPVLESSDEGRSAFS